MKQYLDLNRKILAEGVTKTDRTGTGTKSIFAPQMRFDLQKEFPIVKAKFTAFKLVAIELIWLLSGNTNIKFLTDNNCSIWDDWADAAGELGPVYGEQWRKWKSFAQTGTHADGSPTYSVQEIDQIRELVNKLKTNPDDRRMIISAWNVADIPQMKLPPCHAFFQFYTSPITRERRVDLALTALIEKTGRPYFEPDEEIMTKEEFDGTMDTMGIPKLQLSCQLYQRSADVFLGVPFNIASYALLTHMLAQTCGMDVGEFVWTGGDTHLYSNHIEKTELMLSREPITSPTSLWLNPEVKDIDDFKLEDIRLINYIHHPAIKADVAV